MDEWNFGLVDALMNKWMHDGWIEGRIDDR